MFETIQIWVASVIESQLNSPLFFLAIFVLGLIAAVGSCCNLGVMAAVTTYAGTANQQEKEATHLKTGLSFFVGNVLSLSLLGLLTGWLGQSVGNAVGDYWRLVAGFVVLCLGLKSLDMLPFDLSLGAKVTGKIATLANRGFVFGIVLGGFATACSASCSPIFPIILGTSFLQGSLFMGWLTLFIFAIGYSLPLGGILVGAGWGFDKLSQRLLNSNGLLQQFFGGLLIVVGFGLLLGWM